ncbi:MAG: hypothetical protein P4L50_19055, partial [Anaerolineaceae bacterium]|nr:hypothetical protein [Anaerolineaceae bacterium]
MKTSFVSRLKCLFSDLHSIYTNYPKFADPASLCAYYYRTNKFAPVAFSIFFLTVCFSQLARAIQAIILREPWHYMRKVVVIWAILHIFYTFAAWYTVSSRSTVKEKKMDLAFQSRMRFRLRIFVGLITAATIQAPFFIPITNARTETAAATWLVYSITQIMLCNWLVDGVLPRVLFMTAYNVGFCSVAIYCGHFLVADVTKFLYPTTVSFALFVALDKQSKENFLLKLSLMNQKTMYERHLEKVQDPILILSQTDMLFCNA